MKKDREEKTKFPKILPNNQIITTCCIKLQVQETTMNEKLTMIGLMICFILVLFHFLSCFIANTRNERNIFVGN